MNAYDNFATFYDHYKNGDDYNNYMSQYIRIAKANGLSGDMILDLGCGTGSSMLPLLKKGYCVDGVDLSMKMIEKAKDKVKDYQSKFYIQDITQLSLDKRYNLVMAVDDVLNHITSAEALSDCMAAVSNVLDDSDLFMFDINTQMTFEKFFNMTHVYEEDDSTYIWESKFNASLATATITAFLAQGDAFRKEAVDIQERYYTIDSIEALLKRNHMVLSSVYGYKDRKFHTQVDEKKDLKLLLVAKKDSRVSL